MEFLNIVAADITERIGSGQYGQMKDLTVVFPNKRASLFFNQYLAQHNQPPLWAPRYTTISELFQSMSRLTVADPLLLTYYLYKAYIAETGSNETFDHFYSWGEVLLSDFDDIDSAMVDADRLFINISDLEQLKRFDYIDAEQEAAIRKLFSSFNIQSVTQLQERYLQIWKAMPRIYQRLRTMLRQQHYAYPGMMHRDVIELMAKGEAALPHTTYAVVGFNVLNETERRLFLNLRSEHHALFYWDYDEAMRNNSDAEAGMFIADNIKLFGNCLESKPELFRNLKTEKDIRFIASSTDSAQCSYAGQWLADTLSTAEPLNKTAVVLCDESLLPSLLHTIPPTYGDGRTTQVNITMGYPLQETPVVGFVMAILELMYRGWRKPQGGSGGRWRYTHAERVLKHPYTWLMNKADAMQIISRCQDENQSYPPAEWFDHQAFISDIFTPPTADLCADLQRVNSILQAVGTRQAQTADGDTQAFYAESLYTASTIITRFIGLMQGDGLRFDSPDTLLRLMRQALSARTIAFHGEPAVGVQLMGILETRNLDFDNLVMLSVGEGILPKQDHKTSFILNFLREANGMTTMRRRVALYAYHFYRLISRARHITLLYSDSTDGLHRGEMSRFMMQLKYEQADIKEFKIVSPTAKSLKSLQTLQTLPPPSLEGGSSYPPTPTFRPLPQGRAGGGSVGTLSPSALNTYLDCKRWFYLQYICHFHDDEEVSEEVADNQFGSIFHNAMERFYATRLGRTLTAADFPSGAEEEYVVRRLVDKAFAQELFHYAPADIDADRFSLDLSGTQMLNHAVICQYVRKQLAADRQLLPFTVVATERKHYHDFEFEADGETQHVTIGGIVDREDIVEVEGEQRYRIVDYKTSVKAKHAESIESLFDRQLSTRSSHTLQTLYYCEVLAAADDAPSLPLAPTLLYIKGAALPEQTTVRIGGMPIVDYDHQCRSEFTSRLRLLLSEIYSPDNRFEPNDDDTHCRFCPFRALCNN